MYVTEGDAIDLVAGDGETTSDGKQISVDHPDLVSGLRPGDRIALGDGGTMLLVEAIGETRAVARVLAGGKLQGRPGVSLPPERFNLETPTADDLRLLEAVCDAGVDAVAISFVRSASDVQKVRAAVGSGGPMLVAKIETQEAVDDLEQIISVDAGKRDLRCGRRESGRRGSAARDGDGRRIGI